VINNQERFLLSEKRCQAKNVLLTVAFPTSG
jgi:hypothetical protein